MNIASDEQLELRYPIGKFSDSAFLSQTVEENIKAIRNLPAILSASVNELNDEQLDTRYRPGGWSLRQVVHHVADSHMNAYIRLKLALTEDTPVIKPYIEERWAELYDASIMPVEVSLRLLTSLHERWTGLLEQLTDRDLGRKFLHPESGEVSLKTQLALYAWHGTHHTAHIISLRNRLGW
jgi:uncharacterized damage-inducible protein DinB